MRIYVTANFQHSIYNVNINTIVQISKQRSLKLVSPNNSGHFANISYSLVK